jgi:catechol 2,3-dioxygenase-like lactoylglutathione lyase family enzyme
MSFIQALQAAGPAEDRADKMNLYGQFIGDWTMHATLHADDGTQREATGTIHFGWVLDGRAVQDVWVLPGVFHGTTLRVYDPNLDAWHIVWSDPLKQYVTRQLGRAEGPDIIQLGRNDAGEATRWRFVDITPASFRWLGERSFDDGATWQRQAEMTARRSDIPVQKPMLDHISLGVADLIRSRRFYDAALQPLGYRCHYDDPTTLGYGGEQPDFWLNRTDYPVPADPRSGLHVSLSAPTPESVDAFHAAALRSGGQDNGPPGLRPDYGPGYYAAFVIDPDGYRIEAHHQS